MYAACWHVLAQCLIVLSSSWTEVIDAARWNSCLLLLLLCWNVILSCWQWKCHSSPSLPCDWFKEAIRELAKGGGKGGSLLAAIDLHSLNATWLNQFALGRDRWQLWVQKDVLRNVNICEDAEWGASLRATFKGLCEKNSHAKNHHAITLILLVPHTSLKVRRVSWNVRICDKINLRMDTEIW